MQKVQSSPSVQRMVLVLVAVVGAILVLSILYGIFPGLRPTAGMRQFFLGLAACYAEHLPTAIRCDAIAQPAGYTTMFGLPVVLLVSLLYKAGVALDLASQIVEAAFIALAAWGAHRLFLALGMRGWLSWVIVFLFLASPIVFAQDGYGPLRLGFALVPLYGWLDFHFAQRLARSNDSDRSTLFRVLVIGFLVLSLSRTFALYTDGYSFMMGMMLSATLLGSQCLSMAWQRRWVSMAVLPLLFIVPTMVAYVGYRAYVGATVESTVMPLDFFRGQGVDLFALAVPSTTQWFASALGWAHQLSGWMTFSDGPNVSLVYLGWFLVLPALVLAVMALIGRGLQRFRLEALLLATMTLAALILSLGPSLKIADFRDQPPPDRSIVFNDYLMPESAATASLGTDWIYMEVPGVQNMRAVYRWMLLVKLGLLILAGMFLEALLKRDPRHPLAFGLIVLLMIELLPNLPARIQYGESQYRHHHAFVDQALASLQSMGLEGGRVVFVNAEANAGSNHYLANFLCPLADLKCFNLGGDKSLLIARLEWPKALRELSRARYVVGNLRQLLLGSTVDHVVMPLFSLRHAAYWWPPHESVVQQHLEYAREIARQIPAEVERHDWFVVLRADKSGLSAGPLDEPLQSGPVVDIEAWGPRGVAYGSGFNVQNDGRSAFWVKLAEASDPLDRLVLVFDGEQLETFHGGDVISGRFWKESELRGREPGDYQLQILDRETNRIQDIGEFRISQ